MKPKGKDAGKKRDEPCTGFAQLRPRDANGNSLLLCLDLSETIVSVKGPVHNLLALHEEEMTGLPMRAFVPDEDQHFLDGIHNSKTDRCDFRMLRKDSSYLYADANIYNRVNDRGELTGFCLRIYDVTSRMSAINSLIESEEKLSAIVDSTIDLICIFRNGRILYINRAADSMLGYAPLDLIDRDYLTLFDQSDSERVEEIRFHFTASSGSSTTFEARLLNRESGPFDCEFNLKKIVYRGEPAIVAVIRDISAYRKAMAELTVAKSEAESANRIKSDFLAMMSHEIRTPMNGVIGMTSLLLNTKLTSAQRDYTETIQQSGECLIAIINDILDFTRIESGKLALEEGHFELRTCIEDTLDLFALKAIEKGLDLLYMIEPDVPSNFLGDANRLRQILVNLVNNAIKFTEKGEVFISVQLLQDKDGIAELRFSVRDTGIGIRDEKIASLFEPFIQADNSITRKYGGTGLGLAISKRLVNLMEGDIWVVSEPGVGATFNFTVRIKKSGVGKTKLHVKGYLPQLHGHKVLIVDDNQTNLQILKLQFESWGMKPVLAASGQEALGIIKTESRFDLLVLDLQMPGMDGIELAGKIRELGQNGMGQMLLLSSSGDLGHINGGLFAGQLSKPVRLNELYQQVIHLMSEVSKQEKGSDKPSEIDFALSSRLPLRILIAEDNIVNQKLTISLLNLMGYKVDAVMNGREAVDILFEKDFDIILMDVQMPEMSGIEATIKIREAFPASRQPYIIALTANAMVGDREKCLDSGMVDYMAKPINITQLQDMIIRWGTIIHSKS